MADFEMKQGDLLPVITATLQDGTGAAITIPGGSAVTFYMRSITAAPNSSPVLMQPAAILPQSVSATRGQVSYVWQAGDTDVPGDFYAEWKLVYPDGRPQTFPTSGYDSIRFNADLETHMAIRAALLAAGKPMSLVPTDDDVIELRELIGEPTDQYYSDDALKLIIARSDSLYEAAVDVWLKKAARYAALVDMAEVGSARSYSQLQDKALKMAEQYRGIALLGGTEVVVETKIKRPRLSTIQRTKTDSWPAPLDVSGPPGRRFGR